MSRSVPLASFSRRASTVVVAGLVCLVASPALAQPTTDSAPTMPLDQTILVWEDVNFDSYPDGTNWDVEMSTVSTLTGEAAVIGYSQQPAIPEGPCPAPWEDLSVDVTDDLTLCGGGTLKSASIHPTTREVFALVAGADSPNSILYTVNPSTAESTLQAVLTTDDENDPFNVRNIFFTPDGNLFATWIYPGEPLNLIVYAVDTTSGEMTVDQTIDLSGIEGRFTSLTVDPDGMAWLFASENVSSEGVDTRRSSIYTVNLETASVTLAFSVDGTTILGGSFDRQGVLWAHGYSGPIGLEQSTVLLTIEPTECDLQATACVTERADLDLAGGFVVTDVPFASVTGVESEERLLTGSEADIALSGARAGSSYTIQLFSDPVTLAQGSVSRLGSAVSTVVIPENTPPGPHTIVVTYAVPNGIPVEERIPVIVARGQLSATGLPVSDAAVVTIGALGVLLIAAGVALGRTMTRRAARSV